MDTDSSTESDSAGWSSSFPRFRDAQPRVIRTSLQRFVRDALVEQMAAWDEAIPLLQQETRELLEVETRAPTYTAILEYRLPLDARRSDAVFLVADSVVVIELKGKEQPSQADLDQAHAYARDLHAYHRECENRPVHAVLVPTRAKATTRRRDGVWICAPQALDALVAQLSTPPPAEALDAAAFLDVDAYRPLPTLVQAARRLLETGDLPHLKRARAATEPAVKRIAEIAHEAAATRTRRLILITGVPGSGKTLVGMQAVHAHYLDDLAVARKGGKPTSPALFLSGNGPLVQVLQHVLRGGGGGGRTFVRHIKDYLDGYVPKRDRVPNEHLLIFDEAQRAFTPDKVATLHEGWAPELVASEPRLFIDLCERMPEWSVLVGLIGTGQEIHTGEEGGLAQWRAALDARSDSSRWMVHAPAEIESVFLGGRVATSWESAFNLDTELRFHRANDLHHFVGNLIDDRADGASVVAETARIADGLHDGGLKLWLTRDLALAKRYLHERYAQQPEARFGLVASSRDKLLEEFGVPNSWQATKQLRLGPWFSDGDESRASCRHLDTCATEFNVQGLELDMALLCWGADFVRADGTWSNAHARRYSARDSKRVPVQDALQLRRNAYRVLLTRGRDGAVVFVPPDRLLDETWQYLVDFGFRTLTD